MSTAILSLEEVGKAFGGLQVIDGVSFEVRRGSRTALIGPNGAGKTTVFNLISGVYPVDRGRIVLDGTDITTVPSRQRVRHGLARSFQNIRLMAHLSALENVLLGAHARLPLLARARAPAAVRDAEAALHDAGLALYTGQRVSNLPYGVQKRIEVVRALLARPRLLLLDEPAAGLNPAETDELRQLLERVSGAGVTLLVVEHDMNFVHRLCEQVVVLNFGRRIFEGPPQAVMRDRQVRAAYLGSAADPQDAERAR